MTKPEIDIEQIRPELTLKLRHRVLYPNKGSIYTQGMPEDGQGTHFGAFYENQLVAVVSLFRQGTNFQFRKFVVDTAVQQKGVGRQLLQYITEYAIYEGATKLWCNARVTAAGFYARASFNIISKPFSKHGFEYVIMEKPI